MAISIKKVKLTAVHGNGLKKASISAKNLQDRLDGLHPVDISRVGFDESIISGVINTTEKVRYNLFLKGTWNATLTVENKIYIEVIRGQMLDKAKWDEIKKLAPLPAELLETIEGYFNFDWSSFP